MSRIFLNKIDVSSIDYAEIDKRYDFYLIENQGEGFKPNARIFDDSLAIENVLAVQYTRGKSFILMMKKNQQNDSVVAQIIKNAQNEKFDLTKKKLAVPFEKFQHSLIQVLFKAENYTIFPKSQKNKSFVWKFACRMVLYCIWMGKLSRNQPNLLGRKNLFFS